ncbi:ABC transporter ATP-binding protein [Desulforhopalus singaporensis]|uniref:Lipoprotein-releasing system ATP-binding protein n=1 Tax=Desulforhopalus singaporensis TaxID=91360 RepID=A0A1H0K030_9BACT|nr:ABC transporter ATP-binding protein [Desulforhopalus singaporensis]SDO49159.1 lipoprotein-releasing system ATP-binding protein [Desulforhopalus singaporensis]
MRRDSEFQSYRVVLIATDIHKTFDSGNSGKEVLDGVSLAVSPGDFVMITGTSGAGKSTLLHILCGLDQPTSGEVFFDGNPYSTLSAGESSRLRGECFGFVFQTPHLLMDRTVFENVTLPFCYGPKITKSEIGRRCMDILEYVGLGKDGGRYPATLSGGELQRVVFARALVREPRVIFADEPTGSLDRKNSLNMLDLLKKKSEQGCAVVMVTHDHSLKSYGTRFLSLDKR